MPDIQKIVDTKGAAKVGGVMVDIDADTGAVRIKGENGASLGYDTWRTAGTSPKTAEQFKEKVRSNSVEGVDLFGTGSISKKQADKLSQGLDTHASYEKGGGTTNIIMAKKFTTRTCCPDSSSNTNGLLSNRVVVSNIGAF